VHHQRLQSSCARLLLAMASISVLGACKPKCRSGSQLQGDRCFAMSSDESDAGTPRANQTDASSKLDSVSGTAGASGDNRGSQQAAGAGGTADSTATNTAPQSDGTAGTAASTVPMSSTSAATGGASASTVAPACGNNKVETGETCDGDCPVEADCTAPDPCLTPQLMGDASLCSAECSTSPISQCLADDKCCPEGCTSTDDPDCSPSCGNNAIEDGETCDPQSACPTSCDDGDPCTTDMQTGSAAQCNVNCTHEPVVAPKNGDGCCPSNGNANNDGDCTAKCGNGVVEDGETCDPPGSCETSCDDGDPCTVDTSMGDASSCSFECGPKMPVPARGSSDRCCPPNATLMDDPDCPVPSGWTVVERGTCSAGALRLFSGASVACNSSACSCSAAPKNNCRGGIAGVQASGGGPVWVTATSCGASIGSATNVVKARQM